MKNRRVKRRPVRSRSDYALATTGVLLAFGSVSFPWHVHFNPQMYGPPRIEFSGAWKKNAVADISGTLEQAPRQVALPELDDVITGGVPPRDRRPPSDETAANAPLPQDRSAYDIVAIMEGRAVISKAGETYLVEPGSRLPDGTTITTIRRTLDGGEIRTAEGRTYRMNE